MNALVKIKQDKKLEMEEIEEERVSKNKGLQPIDIDCKST